MRQTNIALCPRLKVKEDIPSFAGRMFSNIAILQNRLEMARTLNGEKSVPIDEMIKLLDLILEVEEVNVNNPL